MLPFLQLMGNTHVMFISDLLFRTFAQFLFETIFSRQAWGVCKMLWKFRRGGGFIFLFKNGISGEVGGSYLKFAP